MTRKAVYKWPKPPAYKNPPHRWAIDNRNVGRCSRCRVTWDFSPPAGAFNWHRIVPDVDEGTA